MRERLNDKSTYVNNVIKFAGPYIFVCEILTIWKLQFFLIVSYIRLNVTRDTSNFILHYCWEKLQMMYIKYVSNLSHYISSEFYKNNKNHKILSYKNYCSGWYYQTEKYAENWTIKRDKLLRERSEALKFKMAWKSYRRMLATNT